MYHHRLLLTIDAPVMNHGIVRINLEHTCKFIVAFRVLYCRDFEGIWCRERANGLQKLSC